MPIAFEWRRPKTILTLMLLFAAIVLIIWWAAGYYGTRVFQFDDSTYKQVSEQGDTVTYKQTPGLNRITVRTLPTGKEVQLRGEWYKVRELPGGHVEVQYPSGKVFLVDYSGPFPKFQNESGEWEPAFFARAYGNDGRILQPGEEYYAPTEIVYVTDPDFEPRGILILFFVAVFSFIFGWCSFRYEGFVRFTHKLSYGMWVEDAEPTDAAQGMAKIGGILAMVFSLYIFFQSL